MYGFVIVDYSFQRLVSYATAAQNATCITADAVRLATMVVRMLMALASLLLMYSRRHSACYTALDL